MRKQGWAWVAPDWRPYEGLGVKVKRSCSRLAVQ
jgi:hypothetical protein